MKIYKGSTKILYIPEIRPYSRLLDYGAGFYASSDMEMEEELALERMLRTCGIAGINTYEFDSILADRTLNIRKFDNDSLDWVEYIIARRSGKVEDDSETDIIYAPAPTDEDYYQISEMEYHKGYRLYMSDNIKKRSRPSMVIFKTQKALDCLAFTEHNAIFHEKTTEYSQRLLENSRNMSENLYCIVISIIEYVSVKTGIPCRELISRLYRSRLFRDLSDKGLRVWRFSYAALGEMFISEMNTGNFVYPDADDLVRLEESYYVAALEEYRKGENISGREAADIFEKYNVFDEIRRSYAYYDSPPTMTYEDIRKYIESKKKK